MDSGQKGHNNQNESKALLSLLAYFDIFRHPLSQKELELMLGKPLGSLLDALCLKGVLYHVQGFYMLENTSEWVDQRLLKNKRAAAYQKKIKNVSKLIRLFPFTRSICISGSLSKGVIEEDGDIDFFIMAAHNRIWLNRTMMVLFKKIFLLNSKKYFCVNYFIDEDMLKIPDENIFTAIEIWHLMPVYNQALYAKFIEENSWVQNYFPKVAEREILMPNFRLPVVTRFLEWLLSGKLGDTLDDFCFRYTVKHWAKKFDNYDTESYDLVFRSEKSVSKHHPNNFQKKVLDALEKRMELYQEKFQIAFEELASNETTDDYKKSTNYNEKPQFF